MLWLTWRQHRAELAGALILIAALAVPLILTGLTMREAFDSGGLAACAGAGSGPETACTRALNVFLGEYSEWGTQVIWVQLLPAVAGVFVGAPLLGREFEHGTWKVAFTQSVTRTRWLGVKLAVVGLGVVAVFAVLAALFAWWRTPLNAVEGPMEPKAFNVQGVNLPAAALLAFAVGVLAGAVLRRTVPAMAVALVAFVAIRVPIELYARPHYLPPVWATADPVTDSAGAWIGSPTDWVLDTGYVDAAGHKLTEAEGLTILRGVYGDGTSLHGPGSPLERYLAGHGLRHLVEYQPAARFWTFQLIEAGIYIGLAVVLLAAAVWFIRRRTS
ncbi:transporter [Actinoplanes sp. NPDC049548]|uniref:transporter n=1 Tax=Actinoplanes sp. NPDC049548 TaxID=3155152 RepID=UPI003420347B